MGLLIATWFSASVLEFTPVGKKVALKHLWVAERVLTGVCAYVPNNSSKYPAFLESLEKVLESVPTGNSIVLPYL